jgi:hypothetical protein
MSKLNKKQKKILEVIILFSIAVIALLMWDTFIVFPIKLLVVFLHEASHATAAILTGGSVVKMDIGFNLGGRCELTGGNSFIIASFGYLGSFLFGALMFFSAYSKKYGYPIIIFISVVIILFAVNVVANSTIQIFAVVFAALLLISLKYAPKLFNKYLFLSLGFISCLYVVYDIQEDLLRRNSGYSDATIIAGITGLPEVFWGILWLIISITGLFFLLRMAFQKTK